jgi:Tfp pilus assembly protein PilV
VPSSSGFSIFFVIVAVLVVAVFVLVITVFVRNARAVRRSGHDPLTLQADLATRLMNSDLLSSRRPVEERLQELDALRSRGTITDSEHAAARAEVLKS